MTHRTIKDADFVNVIAAHAALPLSPRCVE